MNRSAVLGIFVVVVSLGLVIWHLSSSDHSSQSVDGIRDSGEISAQLQKFMDDDQLNRSLEEEVTPKTTDSAASPSNISLEAVNSPPPQ